jgi:micrococcal nuclease
MPKKTALYILAVILVASILALIINVANDPNLNRIPQDLLNKAQNTTTNNNDSNKSDNSSKTNSVDKTTSLNADDAEGPLRVVKVRDGDTIELENGMVIRYLYVDTPETVKVGTSVQCFGPESSSFNKEYVFDKVVYLVKDIEPKDQYQRDLRLVFVEGKDRTKPEQSINAELVKLGFAKAKFYGKNTTYKKQFQDLEQTAKDKKLGLWGSCETAGAKK